jgi:hypothetical protein
VVNAGNSAETIRPAVNAPPQITGAKNSLIIGSFAFNNEAGRAFPKSCMVSLPDWSVSLE